MSKSLRGWIAACGLAYAMVFLVGCSTTSGGSSPGGADAESVAAATEAIAGAGTNTGSVIESVSPGVDPEMLKVGDYLTIKYDDLPTMVPNFDGHIKPDGSITLIMNQRFDAAGKTPGQLEEAIRTRYVPQFFKNMTVTVKPVNESRIFYVGGEVRGPGRQMYVPGITVFKAIQSAGYFTDFANQKKVKLTRADGKTSITIDCKKVMKDPSKDVEVYPNDTIIVPRSLY